MKGLKLGIIGICLALFGLSLATQNFFAWLGTATGLLVAIIGYFVKEGK